jgi:hypothetical protein
VDSALGGLMVHETCAGWTTAVPTNAQYFHFLSFFFFFYLITNTTGGARHITTTALGDFFVLLTTSCIVRVF